MTKAKRPGKVFLDWSQNSGSKTTVSPYSLRGKERPTAATPLTWEEVEEGAEDDLALDQFTMGEVLERVAELGDVFEAWHPVRWCPHAVRRCPIGPDLLPDVTVVRVGRGGGPRILDTCPASC